MTLRPTARSARSLSLALLLLAGCSAPSPAPDVALTPDATSVDAADATPPDAAPDAVTDAPSAQCAALFARLDAALDRALEASNSPSVWLAVLSESCGAWEGVRTATDWEPVRSDQLVRIGSVTKTFVAASVLLLANDGRLTLDDPIDRWVEGVPNGANITLRHLLNHTSGLFNYTETSRFNSTVVSEPQHVFTPRELVDMAVANPPYFAPGMGWHYSNTGYVLLGMVVERAAEAPLETVIRTRLLTPAGLARTYFDGPETVPAGELAPGHNTGGVDITVRYHPSGPGAAGAMVANVADMARWAQRLYAGDILPASAREQMMMFVDTGAQAGVRYGLGVFEFAPSVAITRAVGHGGDIPGFHVDMLYLPERRTAFAVAVNHDGANRNAVSAEALRVLAQP